MNTFNRIAGYKEEKEELIRLCNLIKNRELLYSFGGKLPRGLFLLGPNGVGKTVMAKSFIKESNCNVVSISYNDIDNSGDFTSYIRKQFKEASKKTPCILFIDELDKLIGNGDNFFSEENFDRAKILLNEINKYESCEGLFLLAAANENYIIDKSIIRSGRIDRIIRIGLPTEDERLEIIKYYLKNKNYDEDLDLVRVAKLTHGFSGADLETLLNNSVIRAFGENRDFITYDDISDVYYKKIFSSNEKETSLDEEGLKMVAYHEAGHAVANAIYDIDSLDCVTILPRGNANGFVAKRVDEKKLSTFEDKEHEIQIALAGMASEELFLQKRCLGSGSDIQSARNTVTSLVRYCAYAGFNTTLLGVNSSRFGNGFDDSSEERKRAMEIEEDKIINRMYGLVKQLLLDNKSFVEEVASELMEKKILNRDQINDIMNKTKGPKGPLCDTLLREQEELRGARS